MTQETLTTFFGWATVIHFAFLIFATVMIVGLRETVTKWHAKLMSVDAEDIPRLHYQWLGNYKIFALVFGFVPWLALTLM